LLRTLLTRSVTTLGVRTGSGMAFRISCTSVLSVVAGLSQSRNISGGMMTGARSWKWLIWGSPDGESHGRGAQKGPCLPFILVV
jgi:hypothetical protein